MMIKQGTAEWHAWRKQGIGATDAAAICGESEWDTALKKKAKKTTGQKHEQNNYQEWGSRIEPLLVDKLVEDLNLSTLNVQCGEVFVHPEYDWAKCSLDARYNNNDTEHFIIECKTGRMSSKWDPVPDGYYAQVQWQMFVTGIHKVWFSVLIGGVDWFSREVEYNEDYVNKMFVKCKYFWENHLVPKIPPPPEQDGNRDYNALVEIRKYRGKNTEERPPVEIAKEEFARFVLARDNLEKAEKDFSAAKAQIAYLMVDGAKVTFNGHLVAQYIERAGSPSLNKKLFKELAPDIYEKCVKPGSVVGYIKYL
jgi:putative phage-type endonuclease